MNDIFMNFVSIQSLSGRTGGIQSSIAGCSQELRSIACGLELGSSGSTIRAALGNLSNQCSAQAQKVARMGSTLQQAAQIMHRAENRIIQNNSMTSFQKALQGKYEKGFKAAMAAGLAGGGMRAGGGYGGDPVSMFSGSFLWQITPLQTYAGEILEFTIYYDTVYTRDEGMGKGFRHNFMSRIQPADNGIWGIFEGDGSSVFFGEGEDQVFYPQHPSVKKLVRKEDGFWYYDPELLQAKEYDKNGRLIAEYIQGKEVKRLIYDGDHLIKVNAQHGYSYDFTYEENHIVQITDNMGRYIRLEYCNDTLSGITIYLENDAPFTDQYNVRRFCLIYNERDYLTKITGPDEKPLFDNIYDEMGRVVHQSMGEGRFFSFKYEGNKTTNVDETGFTTEYIHDNRGNLLCMENPITKYEAEYDAHDRIIKRITNETDVVLYDYNAFGQLISVIKLGFSHEFFYNDKHKLEEYTFNGRSYLKIHYDSSDNVVAIDHPGEEIHQFFYDDENRLIGYEAQGESCRLIYDERGFIVNVEAPEEFSEEYSYDGIGRISNVKIGNGREVVIKYAFDNLIGYIGDDLERSAACEYDLTGKMISYEEGEQKITCSYDEHGNLTELDLPGEDLHHMEYDIQGNLLKHYQGDFLLEGLTYDENKRVIKVEDGLGYEESYSWNIWNQPTKIINSNGLVVDIGYNEDHFLEELSVDDFHVTYQYDENGRLASISDDEGRYGIYEYDSADRLIQVNTHQAQMELTYDNFSNITLISMADFGYILQNGYDAYNRHTGGKTLGEAFYRIWYGTGEINKIEIVGETIGLAHDSGGRVVTLTNYLGKEVEKKFDQYDSLISIGASDLQDSISYGYDEARRIKWVRDEYGKAMFFSYNGMGILLGIYHLMSREYSVEELNNGDVEWAKTESTACYTANIDYKQRIISLKDSLGNISTQEMTSGGFLRKSIDAIGDSKEITYDPLLRVTGISEKGSHNEESTFRYEQDRIIEATNSNGQVSFDYDLGGRVVGVHYPDGSIAGYEWNQANLCTAMLYPDGSRVEYSYDSFGNLIQTSLPGDTVHYQYDEKQRLIKKQSEKVSHTFEYHENGKLEVLKVQDEEGIVLEIRYAYDEYYNLITEKNISERGREPLSYGYEYDKRGFLVKSLKNGEVWGEYIYDASGNRIYSKEQGEEASYSYNVENQLLEKKTSGHIYTYEYNTRGDMICECLDGKVFAQYQYNGLGQLLQVSNENGTVSYSYDAMGNRLEADFAYKDLKKEKEIYYPNYLVDNGQTLCKRKHNENITHNQYFDGSPLAENIDGRLIWDIFDANQSLVLRLERENSYEMLDYSPFGVCEKYSKGEEFDAFSTVYGFGALLQDDFLKKHISYTRVYDPQNGRFQSRDAVIGDTRNPRSFNRYIYSQNDPQNKQDPDGFSVFLTCLLSGAAKAGAYLAKEAIVAGKSIVSNVAMNAIQGKPLNILGEMGNYAKNYRWDKMLLNTAGEFATGCLDPVCGGMASALKKGIKFATKIGGNALDCAREGRPFFSAENAMRLTGDMVGDALGKAGKRIVGGLYDAVGNKLVNGARTGIKNAFNSPVGKVLREVVGKGNMRRAKEFLYENVSKEKFYELASKGYKKATDIIVGEFKRPSAGGDNFCEGAKAQGEGIGACARNPVQVWARG